MSIRDIKLFIRLREEEKMNKAKKLFGDVPAYQLFQESPNKNKISTLINEFVEKYNNNVVRYNVPVDEDYLTPEVVTEFIEILGHICPKVGHYIYYPTSDEDGFCQIRWNPDAKCFLSDNELLELFLL
jgi:hypothetical protein